MRKLVTRNFDEQISQINFRKVLNFYAANRNDMNSERDPIEVANSLNSGNTFVIEDDFGGAIKGIGLCIQHSPAYYELGGDRVIENGYALQAVLVSCRSLNTMFFMPPDQHLYAVIDRKNVSSIRSYAKSGFVETAGDDAMFYDTGYSRQQARQLGLQFYSLADGPETSHRITQSISKSGSYA